MKKFSLISMTFLGIALCLASCEGPMGPMGPMGPQGPAGPGSFTIIDITVPANEWKYSDSPETPDDPGNNYFYTTVPELEEVLTEDVFKGGLVKMYRVYNWNTNNPSQVELPFTHPVEVWTPTEEDPYRISLFTETVDCEFGIGWMEIYYSRSDFQYEVDYSIWPDEMHFRCVIIY